jgi:hypothetical protein
MSHGRKSFGPSKKKLGDFKHFRKKKKAKGSKATEKEAPYFHQFASRVI